VALFARLARLLRPGRFDAELEEELALHRTLKQQELERDGLRPDEAALAARRALGNTLIARERSGDVWRLTWLQGIGQDLRLGVRMLLSARLVSLVAVLSLGLGIGANTALFSLINGLYLRALPVDEPEGLIAIAGPSRYGRVSGEFWEQLRGHLQAFEGAAAYSSTQFHVGSGGDERWVDGLWVSGTFFDTVGVRAFAGRLLSPADDQRGGAFGPATVISHRFWQARFGGSPTAIGQPLEVNGVRLTIVGVTPPEFFGPLVGRSFDVAVPLAETATLASEASPFETGPSVDVIARLGRGQSLEAANAALRAIQPRLAAVTDAGPDTGGGPAGAMTLTASPAATGQSYLRGEYRRVLLTLMAAVALVLLVACANIANLLLSRATARRHELSLRRAIGASQWRLVRQCLTESVILSGAGAVCGLVLATWVTPLLVRELAKEDALTAGQIAYGSGRLFLDVSLDWRVLAFTVAAGALTTLVFGVVPAIRSAGVGAIEALKDHAATPAGQPSSFSGRLGLAGAVVVAQVALSLTLVVAAGLFGQTFASLSRLELGYEPERVLTVDVAAARSRADLDDQLRRYEQIRQAVTSVPGVDEATIALGVPPIELGAHEAIVVSGEAPVRDSHALANVVSAGWFRTFGVRLLAGRDFTGTDRRGTAPVAIVTQSFAQTFLNGASPIGRTIVSFETPVQIVGMVSSVANGRLQDTPAPMVFIPLAQVDGRLKDLLDIVLEERGLVLGVRASSGSPMLLRRSVAAAVEEVAPDQALTFHSVDEQVKALITRERVVAALSMAFGGLALLLAGLGLYGVAAYAVSRRRREIGIRMALGAAAAGVVRMILSRMMVLVVLGVALGAMLSVWAAQFVESLLYGLEPRDPVTFGGAALILVLVAALAAWLPARRASRIDPVTVLRYE
jgi:putative ABC transport system permease protein